jgi:hypothetical protein
VPWGEREAKDVGQRPRAPVGDRPGERQQRGRSDLLGADDRGELRERALVVRRVDALEQPAVDESAGEAHPDADAGLRVLRHGLGHGVVERPVEVGKAGVDGDPRDRQLVRQHRRAGRRADALAPDAGHGRAR